jgi:benzylsuccinate CoA-transferase BbsE subunit
MPSRDPTWAFTPTPPPDPAAAGPLQGLRVVEVASEAAAFCGKLLADHGADVVLVEPTGGHRTRSFEPFADDVVDPDRSLWFWHYNTSKRGVTLDFSDAVDADRFRDLVARADVVLEAEPRGHLHGFGLDAVDLRPSLPRLIWVSVTPFGRDDERSSEPVTDLTVLSAGGPVWMCGYDDHTLPPVRGGGNQGYQIAAVWAALGTLLAVHSRELTGRGQVVDVSLHAAVNVTTEQATYSWLVAGEVVQRQTARHAAAQPTDPVIAVDRNGHDVHTGLPPRSAKHLTILVQWLDDLGLRDRFPDIVILELAIEAGGIDLTRLEEDAMTQEHYRAARDAMVLLASSFDGYDFFLESQRRGLPVGVIYAPEEAIADPHLVERGFPVEVHHEDLGRVGTYPGAPVRFTRSPWRLERPAPRVGQHQAELDTLWPPEAEGR